MYFLTSIRLSFHPEYNFVGNATSKKGSLDCRCWGYYLEEATAIKAAVGNWADMEERYYEYLVIEKVPEGIHALSKEIAWYRWDENSGCWVIYTKPEQLERTINFSIG